MLIDHVLNTVYVVFRPHVVETTLDGRIEDTLVWISQSDIIAYLIPLSIAQTPQRKLGRRS